MIKFRFENWADVWAMNGHGPFVWAAYAITLVALIALVIYPIYQQRKFLKECALRQARMRQVEATQATQRD